ncbi:ribonuclease III [Limisphaera sp. VF-2]|uniref:ribonuclease III n=1 Tax=Limisphaera sp. VF-2 TaxID=3400418 RepID=UPI0017556CB5|nr:ribonuclease III [Limisphaera sp.]
MSATDALETRVGWRFRDRTLLRLALTHPSVATEPAATLQTNQRLEFLGDAVLQLVLTRELYDRFPTYEEGRLTKARARLVNRRTLAERARALNLGSHLILSPGEERHGGRQRISSLADAYEALIGALYLDGGFEVAQRFVLREFEPLLAQVETLPAPDNPKGELQELLQARSAHPPEYRLVNVTGPDHERVFECAVWHEGQELGRGKGPSKKAAESEAALAALKRLQGGEAGAAAGTSIVPRTRRRRKTASRKTDPQRETSKDESA